MLRALAVVGVSLLTVAACGAGPAPEPRTAPKVESSSAPPASVSSPTASAPLGAVRAAPEESASTPEPASTPPPLATAAAEATVPRKCKKPPCDACGLP